MAENLTALAVCDENIADTVGAAEAFVIWDGQTHIVIPPQGSVALFLEQHRVTTLICGGIGNCLAEVLNQRSIRVIPGIEGSWQEAIIALQHGTLVPGRNCTCIERGQICGDCPGNY